jgi:hypothetical protein
VRRAALDNSLQLLLCVAAALLVTPACVEESHDCGGWVAEDVMLGASGTIVALHTNSNNEYVALLREGKLVHFDGEGSDTWETIPATGLRAWAELESDALVVVGDGGQIVRREGGSDEWSVIDAGITEDLIDIVAPRYAGGVLAIANDRVLYSSDAGMTWTELAAPAGSWTGLRRAFSGRDRSSYWLIGDGGQVWTSTDPSAGWEAFELDTSADLIDGVGTHCETCAVIASADALYLSSSDVSWPAPEGEVIVAVAGGYVTTDRAVYSIDLNATTTLRVTKVQNLDFTPSVVMGAAEGVFLAGLGGELVRIKVYHCLGRPWLIDGTPKTATLPGLASPQGWARDGLFEHASVASFARFVSELLALGAPPALIQAAQAAILDELEHARLCFELAAREHGRLRPGPLPLDPHSSARAGDPVALVLAVFEEGCLGESIAAVEAGLAAAEHEDADARRALERIAADERRHAALAWRTLRWLLDEFGAPVRAALRARLATLEASGDELRVRTIAEVTRPLALALLTVDSSAPRAVQT